MCDKPMPLYFSVANCALIADLIEESLLSTCGCALTVSASEPASTANGAKFNEHATAAMSNGVFFMRVSLRLSQYWLHSMRLFRPTQKERSSGGYDIQVLLGFM